MAWFTRVLGSDLVPYFEQVPYADEDYWKTLHAGLAEILSSVQGLGSELSAAVLKNIGPHEQILCSLAAQGAREDFENVLSYRAENGTGFEAQIRDDRFFARLEYLAALTTSQPDELLEIPPAALTPASHVRSEGWSNDGALMFGGHFYLRGLDSDAYPGEISVLVKDGTGKFRDVEVSRVQDPQLDMLGSDPYASHAAAGFTCRVGADHLGNVPQGTIEVVVNLAFAQEVVVRRHIVGLAPPANEPRDSWLCATATRSHGRHL